MKYKCPICKKEFEEAEWEEQTNKNQTTIRSIYGTVVKAACCPHCSSISQINAIIKTTEENKRLNELGEKL